MGDEVVLLDAHHSVFGMRVRIALAEKGVEYEYKEQDLANKTPLLLESNPIHKKIPVLIHNGKPICESLIIVEYIDEVWNHDSPLLPSHPYQRAHARFWANFVDQKEKMGDEVVLLNAYVSPFSMRVRIALAEKGVEYEYKEEDIANKTPLLLESNPIHKKIPVLIHNAKPICESLIIVEYIDQVWNHDSPLLPSHPYQRAHARFWANFVNQKVDSATRKIGFAGGEEQETGKNELLEALKVLEGELGEKAYFGGDEFGFIDLAFIVFSTWFDLYESLGKFSIEEKFPKLIEWVKRCMEKQSVSKSLADRKKVNEFVMGNRKKLGLQ